MKNIFVGCAVGFGLYLFTRDIDVNLSPERKYVSIKLSSSAAAFINGFNDMNFSSFAR